MRRRVPCPTHIGSVNHSEEKSNRFDQTKFVLWIDGRILASSFTLKSNYNDKIGFTSITLGATTERGAVPADKIFYGLKYDRIESTGGEDQTSLLLNKWSDTMLTLHLRDPLDVALWSPIIVNTILDWREGLTEDLMRHQMVGRWREMPARELRTHANRLQTALDENLLPLWRSIIRGDLVSTRGGVIVES